MQNSKAVKKTWHKTSTTRIAGCLNLLILLFFIIFFCPIALAENSLTLINNAYSLDGKQVTFEGEAIGDKMIRGNFAWINVEDKYNAFGIWLPKDMAGQIKITGNYKATGDYIKIKGIFYRACRQHGGDMDIHASSIEIIKAGEKKNIVINWWKLPFIIFFSLMILLLLILRIIFNR